MSQNEERGHEAISLEHAVRILSAYRAEVKERSGSAERVEVGS